MKRFRYNRNYKESAEYTSIRTSADLVDYVKSNLDTSQPITLLLDEIQEVKDWEKALRSFMVDYLYEVPREDTVGKKILREFGALELLGDNYPKYVLSLDEFPRSRNGIQGLNLIDWLQ